MATSTATLRPTGTLEFDALADATVVGTAPQWADDSDASYVLFDGTGGVVQSTTAALAGETLSITFHLRAAAIGGSFEVFLPVRLQAAGFTDGFFNVPNDGVIHDLIAEADMVDTPPDWLATGPFFSVEAFLFNDGQTLTIYDIWAVVTLVDEEVRVTRLHPRKDAYGPMGSGPRLAGNIPPERIIGGHM